MPCWPRAEMLATAESCTGGLIAGACARPGRLQPVVRARLCHVFQRRQGRDAGRALHAHRPARRRERARGPRHGRRRPGAFCRPGQAWPSPAWPGPPAAAQTSPWARCGWHGACTGTPTASASISQAIAPPCAPPPCGMRWCSWGSCCRGRERWFRLGGFALASGAAFDLMGFRSFRWRAATTKARGARQGRPHHDTECP